MLKVSIFAGLITLLVITGPHAQTAGEAPQTTIEKALCIFAHYWDQSLQSVHRDHEKGIIEVEVRQQENEVRIYYR